ESRDALYFGLPGNPVAAMVAFYQIVRDALIAMTGALPHPAPLVRASALDAIGKRPGRTEYPRGIARRRDDGHWEVTLTGAQGSGILRSMSDANCFVILDHHRGPVAVGDTGRAATFANARRRFDMKKQISYIAPGQTAKALILVYLTFSVPIMLLGVLVALIRYGSVELSTVFSALILNALLGFVLLWIACRAYNWVASRFGGIEIVLSDASEEA
ncbi:hypothetical protein DFQ30_002331, partial [Apophysomyces sp. BC1015]